MAKTTVTLIPYLMYAGNCEEALNFFKGILGGNLEVRSRYDNPAMNAPADYKDKILHARLEIGEGFVLYASDNFPGKPTHKSSGDVSLSLIFAELDKAKMAYERLAEGGKAGLPFAKQFWGDWHGNLVDRYGFNWNINFEEVK
jgi:PhnB protein